MIPNDNPTSSSELLSSCTKDFSACTIAPVTGDGTDDDDSSSTVFASNGKFTTTSFFLDTSGRSKVSLPLELKFESSQALESFVAAGCIHPSPTGNSKAEENSNSSSHDNNASRYFTGFEVTTVSPHDENDNNTSSSHSSKSTVTVEGITVLSTWIEGGTSVVFDTEVVLWAEGSVGDEGVSGTNTNSNGGMMNNNNNRSQILTHLEIMAVLSEKREMDYERSSSSHAMTSRLLDFGRVPDYIPHASSLFQQTRLAPIGIQVALVDALSISVKSVSGASDQGNTMVSLTIRHSNTHSEPVTITNIALHPGHSRLLNSSDDEANANQSNVRSNTNNNPKKGHHYHYSVKDMTKFVQWAYAPNTEPQLPLTLKPHDAFTTVIQIDAAEDTRSRTMISPVTVAAVLGSRRRRSTQQQSTTTTTTHRYGIVASSDAKWTLGRVAFEPSDAFRIHMNLPRKSKNYFQVGESFTVSLQVLNLSSESRDIMLLVAKDIEKAGGMAAQSNKRSSVNTAVVSEVNGYTFGVWGLLADADDEGLRFRFDRDHDLLAVDTALLLGEVKGRHSVQAQLRFNPLREGTLDVPNLQLFDKKNRKWYYCAHKLKIVAQKE